MSRSGGQSEARPPVFKSPRKLGTHLSTHCRRDESYTRAFGDGPRNFEPWSSDVDEPTTEQSRVCDLTHLSKRVNCPLSIQAMWPLQMIPL
ncbi:hypothetical protein TNCV_3851571 [Trichonephila clavipes]|nr:hypothetical protein TNCV_3851571 [Trichonephila clavipes]